MEKLDDDLENDKIGIPATLVATTIRGLREVLQSERLDSWNPGIGKEILMHRIEYCFKELLDRYELHKQEGHND